MLRGDTLLLRTTLFIFKYVTFFSENWQICKFVLTDIRVTYLGEITSDFSQFMFILWVRFMLQ